jgi:hypothetical protein
MEGGIKAWIDAGYPVESSFVDELDCVDKPVKTTLNAKISNILCYLEKGNDAKAIEKIGTFNDFVNETKAEGRLDSAQADYLIHESTVHLKDLI